MTITTPNAYKNIKQESKLNYNVTKILSAGSTNFKTAKNNKGVTFIMYIAPAAMNNKGVNLCPMASAGCLASCLNTAGRGVMTPVKDARLNKANYYVNDKMFFLIQLATEIMNKIKYYQNKNTTLFFRLNGTSDVDFLGQIKKNLGIDFLTFENVVFYDYTAILGKVKKYQNSDNYYHTFSRKENNDENCISALNLGVNVAAVFRNELPKTWNGFKVVNGDLTDIEMLNYKGVVLGLTAKGKAKKDTTGFVID
jgi:hypothetical protein